MKKPLLLLFLLNFSAFLSAQDCDVPRPAGESCATAPFLCDFTNYCTDNTAAGPDEFLTPTLFCGAVENDLWVGFTAAAETVSVEVVPLDCTGLGLQGMIFYSADCESFTGVSECVDGEAGTFVLTAENLTVGENYFIMIDGENGALCTYALNIDGSEIGDPAWANAGEDVPVCEGETAILDGTGYNNTPGEQILWTTDDGEILSGAETLNPTVSGAGSYVLTISDELQGCVHSDTVFFSGGENYELTVEGGDDITCLVGSVFISAEVNGELDWNYVWTDSLGNIVSEAAAFPVSSAGIYTVTATLPGLDCVLTETVEINAFTDEPEAVILPVDTITCANETVILDASASVFPEEYILTWEVFSWSTLTFTDLDPLMQLPVNEPGLYFLEITNPVTGCTSDVGIEVITLSTSAPDSVFYTLTDFCETGSILQIDSVAGGEGDLLFSFDDSNFSDLTLYEDLAAGTYPLTVIDSNSCTLDTLIQIPGISPPLLDLGQNINLNLGESLTLQPVTNADSLTYFWSADNNFLSCQTCPNPVIMPTETGFYFLEITDENGCTASDTIQVTVNRSRSVYIPNAFSPDNDGINDRFTVYGGASVLRITKMEIYDRWGSRVFRQTDFAANDPAAGFDGRFKGQILHRDVYVYVVEAEFIDGTTEVFSGEVMLLR